MHPHLIGSLQRTPSGRAEELPYDAANQLTHYGVRSAQEVYQDLLKQNITIPTRLPATFSRQSRQIPRSVQEFSSTDEHMLFIPNDNESEEKKVQTALDIRLGPVLKGLLKTYGEQEAIEAFQGSVHEMIAFYRSRDYELDTEILFPSTGRYYRFTNQYTRKDVMVLGALQSEANLISQLLTLKKAGVAVNDIKIYGDTTSINQSIANDIEKFRKLLISKKADFENAALVIAGNGGILDEAICKLDYIDSSREIITSSTGSRCKMTYYPLKGESGLINLQMPYGEVMGPMVSIMAKELYVRRIFLAGVGGALINSDYFETRPVGQFYLFGKSSDAVGINSYELEPDEMMLPDRKLNASAVIFDDLEQKNASHVHVDSPFLETKLWLECSQQRNHTIVDCETYYCFEAIKHWNKENPHNKIKIMPGLFISDVVGHKSLVSVSHDSYQCLELVLENFVEQIQEEKLDHSAKCSGSGPVI
jgi:hypothetical protein